MDEDFGTRLADVDTSPEAIKNRTDLVLSHWHGQTGEMDCLYGLLCLGHGWDPGDSLALNAIIDMSAVARRIDALRDELLASGVATKEAGK